MPAPEPGAGKRPWSHSAWPPLLILLGMILGPSLVTLLTRPAHDRDVFAFLAQRQVGKGAEVVERIVGDPGRMALYVQALRFKPRDGEADLLVRSKEVPPEVLADAGQRRVSMDCSRLEPLAAWPLPDLLEQLVQARTQLGVPLDLPYYITLMGDGPEHTLVRASSIRAPADAPLCLMVQGMTLVLDDQPLVDAPDRPVLLTLSNAKVVGFDGGSDPVLFRGRAIAVHATRSSFLGGFGTRPGLARLFDVKTSALLARFDGGALQDVELGLGTLPHGAGVHFEQTRLEDLRDRPLEPGSRPGVRFELVDCPLGRVSAAPGPRRSLSELSGVSER